MCECLVLDGWCCFPRMWNAKEAGPLSGGSGSLRVSLKGLWPRPTSCSHSVPDCGCNVTNGCILLPPHFPHHDRSHLLLNHEPKQRLPPLDCFSWVTFCLSNMTSNKYTCSPLIFLKLCSDPCLLSRGRCSLHHQRSVLLTIFQTKNVQYMCHQLHMAIEHLKWMSYELNYTTNIEYLYEKQRKNTWIVAYSNYMFKWYTLNTGCKINKVSTWSLCLYFFSAFVRNLKVIGVVCFLL